MTLKINNQNVHSLKKGANSIDTYDLLVANALVKENYKRANELYEFVNLTYHQHLQQDLNHHEELDYLTTKLNERKFIDKEYLSRAITSDDLKNISPDFTLKQKIQHYSKRVNDPKLTDGQRRYAQMFLQKNK